MFNSFEDFENSPAFVAFLVVAIPLLVGSIVCLVLWVTSHMSGWRRLAKLYRYDGEDVVQWMFRGGGGVFSEKLPFAGMRGRLAVGAAKDGIVIKAPWITRPFHPALFLPFADILNETDRKFLTLDFVTITMQGLPDVRVSILKVARDMVESARITDNLRV